MKGLVLFVVAFGGGLYVGKAVILVLCACNVDRDLSTTIGVAVWLFGAVVFMSYGSLWWSTPEELAERQMTASPLQHRRQRRAESKLQTAELRMGFVFAMLGGAATSTRTDSTWIVLAVAAVCAAFGATIGYDLKRRVRKIRDRLDNEKETEPRAG
ncbi:MAG: hypothetical protein JW888_17385 [Pirellulales bacterium]|nr:hypothetical protein [Pirellulales bacterium]